MNDAVHWSMAHAGYSCDAPGCKVMYLDPNGFQLCEGESKPLAALAELDGWTRWEREGTDRVYTYCPKHARRNPRLAQRRGFRATWRTTQARRDGRQ